MGKRTGLCATPPVEQENISITKPKEVAAGIPSLISSLRHISNELTLTACTKTLPNLNQFDGFDCPGCAWPDPSDERSSLGEFCENGVKAITEEATKKRVTPDFFQKHSIQELSTWSDYQLGKSGRLTEPMILREGSDHYEPISWRDAYSHISKELNSLDSPDEAVFYTSGRTSNEAAFLYQLFVRQFGTNNLPDCSNMCHESSGVGLSETLGIGKGSVRLEDFYVTDLIIIMGQNPGTNHPRMLSALQKAKKNGAKIISINPLMETGLMNFRHPQELSTWLGQGTSLSDLFLPVRINQDVALLKAVMKMLYDREQASPGNVFDKYFIEYRTSGFEEFMADLARHKVEELLDRAGITRDQANTMADMIQASEKMIICWAMGLTQHVNGVENIREVVNLLLLRGSIGKPGAGTCPVRGHSNVQGDRTVGIWESPPESFLNSLEAHFDFQPPRKHGYNTVNAIHAMSEGKVGVFFAMGGNFLSATPDTEFTANALQNCNLTVQVSTKLNRSHLITGRTAIILPCLGRTEEDVQATGKQFVSVENSMGIVHASRGRLKPASEKLRSEIAIVGELAQATFGSDSPVDWAWYVDDYDRIRDAIDAVIPGFDDYNKRVREPGGFYLPNGARDGQFHTDERKAKFTVNPVPEHGLKDGEFMMMTIRSHDQFNTTIYGLNDRYRGIKNGRRVVLMHREDISRLGLKAGGFVDLFNKSNGQERIAPKFMIVEYAIPKRCVATYFPEANVLVPIELFAKKSYTPASKSVPVQIRKASSAK